MNTHKRQSSAGGATPPAVTSLSKLPHWFAYTAIISLVTVVAACSQKHEAPAAVAEAPAAGGARMAADMAPAMRQAAPAPAPAAPPPPPSEAALSSAAPAQQMGSSAATYTDSERKFIRTAKARFAVKDVYVAALGIEDTVAGHGGFVVKNDIGTERLGTRTHPLPDNKLMELTEYAVNGHLVVRVPSARTQEFLRAIVGHIVFLDRRDFGARDAQFDLLRQQLDQLRNQETQGELGDAIKNGGKLQQKSDAVALRNEVKAARDAAHIAKKEFEDQVAFSTIELTLYQPSRVLQTEKADVGAIYRQYRPGFFPRLGESLRGGWEGLLESVLALAAIWPALLIMGALTAAVLSWRAARRRRKAGAGA